MRHRCVIVGSGLGGLATGVLLAREGYEVCIVEQSSRVGGCLQCFERDGSRFETGMHFVGSLDEGQVLNHYLNLLGIRERLVFDRLDPQGYDIVSLAGERFAFANGREPMMAALLERFPNEYDGLCRYWQLVDKVAQTTPYYRLSGHTALAGSDVRLFDTSLDEVLDSIVSDSLLKNVLVGNMMLYAARRGISPFATHAFVADFYNNSAFRVVGGSQTIADELVNALHSYGGTILTGCRVVRVCCKNGVATAVELDNGSRLPSDIVVSDAHPSQLKEWFAASELRACYLNRLGTMANTTSAFSLFLRFKPESLPYMNHNFYGFAPPSPWDMPDYSCQDWPRGYLYMHHCHKPQPQFADCGVVLAYMSAAEWSQWYGTRTGRRGSDYEDFKRYKAEQMLAALEKDFPGIRRHIATFYTATPLTYRDYTLTPDGSIYGIEKDVNHGIEGRITYRTRVPNFFLVGQNVTAHGMLGVLAGVAKVCSHLLGEEVLSCRMQEANSNIAIRTSQLPDRTPTTLVMGAGLGGLLVAALLTREGHRVTLLERNREVGGGLCTFYRAGIPFATGMHLFGGFQQGGQLRALFAYLGILHRFHFCQSDSVDEVLIPSKGIHYRIPRGRKAYTEYFCQFYPKEADNICRYVDALYRLAEEEALFCLRPDDTAVHDHSDQFVWSVGRFMEYYIPNEELRGVLSYVVPLYAGVLNQTPAYIHALISVLHIEGTSQFVTSSSEMAEALANIVIAGGGRIFTQEPVERIEVEEHNVSAVVSAKGIRYQADYYVSDLPIHTLLSVTSEGAFPRAFRQRITDASDSYSAFKVYIGFRPATRPHCNSPLFFAENHQSVWHCANVAADQWPTCAMILTQRSLQYADYDQSMTVICPMSYQEVSFWQETVTHHRSESYLRWKRGRTDRVLQLLETLFHGITQCIETVEASSPLTIRDYLGNRNCGMYGLHKDCRQLMQTQLSVRTKVRNLFLTGQDVNLHGMCGVALTSIATAEAVLNDSGLRLRIRAADNNDNNISQL